MHYVVFVCCSSCLCFFENVYPFHFVDIIIQIILLLPFNTVNINALVVQIDEAIVGGLVCDATHIVTGTVDDAVHTVGDGEMSIQAIFVTLYLH